MGYYIEQRGGYFNIPAGKVGEAEAAVRKAVAEHGRLSWVSHTDAMAATNFTDLMNACRWEVSTDASTGNVIGIHFRGEKCGGDEDVVLRSLAPYVESGCYIEMQGEEGERWRWVFEGGGFDEIYATVNFGDRSGAIKNKALDAALNLIRDGEGDKNEVLSLLSKALSI